MKKFVITLVIMFAFMMTSCGQNDVAIADNSNVKAKVNSMSDSTPAKEFVAFTPEQKKKAKQIAKKQLGFDVIFGSSVIYRGKKYYWTVESVIDFKTYAFTSSRQFTNVTFENANGFNAKDYAKSKN